MDTSFQQQQQASASASNPAVAVQRLQKELMDLMAGDGTAPEGVTAFPSGDDLFAWDATLLGPPGTYYAGIEYKLALTFSPSYPFAAPKVRFVTPCFHPNVAVSGAICLDILGEAWSAVMSVGSVLLSLQALLETPNNNSPLNEAAAKAWANAGYMRAEALRVAGVAATTSGEDKVPAADPTTTNSGGAAPSVAATTNANPPAGDAQAASSAAAAAAAAVVSMSPQEQRTRAHRGESYDGGAQSQPPHSSDTVAAQS